MEPILAGLSVKWVNLDSSTCKCNSVMVTSLPSTGGGGVNSLRLTEEGLAGFAGGGPRVLRSGRAFLGGGGGTTNSSETVSDPSSVLPSNSGAACTAHYSSLLPHWS